MREFEQFGRRVEQETRQAEAERDLQYCWDRDAYIGRDPIYQDSYDDQDDFEGTAPTELNECHELDDGIQKGPPSPQPHSDD